MIANANVSQIMVPFNRFRSSATFSLPCLVSKPEVVNTFTPQWKHRKFEIAGGSFKAPEFFLP